MMATMAHHDSSPSCMNCQTSTTPLWRRDEVGSVLCNACGLFLKLHGRPRPISLKTDVIKSRNRVKSSGSGQSQKKKQNLFDGNGHVESRSQAGTPPLGLDNRRASQKSANGGISDGSNSPISRTATPSMYVPQMHGFDGHELSNHHFSNSPNLAPLHLRQPSPGRSDSSMAGDRHLDVPQTFEQLLAANSSLKTRVSELEVINELFRGRVTQLEQDESNARRGEEMRRESESHLKAQVDDLLRRLQESQRREGQLKRRLDDIERERGDVLETREGPRAKKMRLADMVGDSEVSTPQSISS